jgi:predicted enzyme related to lactoylglutathione lyase
LAVGGPKVVGQEVRGVRPLIRKIDAVTVPVPDLDSGLRFYRDRLGHELLWRNDELGQAGLGLPESDAEIVLTTRLGLAPAWLVTSADEAAAELVAAGGRLIAEPADIPVGRVVVVADPFGNALVLVDLSKGRYVTGEGGSVTGVAAPD